MILSERVCLIRLTANGKRALDDIVTVTEKGSFEAWVKEQDDRGIWVSPIKEEEPAGRRAGLILLVKWDYLATVEILGE